MSRLKKFGVNIFRGNTSKNSSPRRSSTNVNSSLSLVPLYEACYAGNESLVRQLLPNYSQHDLNQPLPSHQGNTCLHVAAANGHDSIVQLLLEHGCYRSAILNHDQQSPYNVAAATKESTRLLFLRHQQKNPSVNSSSRFHASDAMDCFDFVRLDDNDRTNPAIFSPISLERMQIFSSEEEKRHEMEYSASSKAMCQSRVGRFCINHFHHDEPLKHRTIIKRMGDLLKLTEAENTDDALKAKVLLQRYQDDDHSIEQLLHLYTLETEFYRSLKNDCLPLAIPLFIHLSALEERYFQGRVYRGMRMSYEQILIYQNMMKTPGTVLQTRIFQSTSINRCIAEQFAYWKREKRDQDLSVLFMFDFPEVCDQAINLSRISKEKPCLSEYEDENEVLILPWTLFEVTRVRWASNEEDLTMIHLTNRIIPRKNLLSTFKWSWVEVKNQIKTEGKVKFNCGFQKYRPPLTQTK